MHLNWITEEISIDKERLSVPEGKTMFHALLKYLMQFYESTIFVSEAPTKEGDMTVCGGEGVVDYLHDFIHWFRSASLIIDDEEVKIKGSNQLEALLSQARKLYNAKKVTFRADYCYNTSIFDMQSEEGFDMRYKPSYVFFSIDDSNENVASGIELRAIELPDSSDGEYNFFLSKFGETALHMGKELLSPGLSAVENVQHWNGDYLSLVISLQPSIGKENMEIIHQAFIDVFEEKYGQKDFWDSFLEETDDDFGGGGWGSFSFSSNQLKEFLLDIEKFNQLISSINSQNSISCHGYLVSDDPDHPFGIIYLDDEIDDHVHPFSTQLQ